MTRHTFLVFREQLQNKKELKHNKKQKEQAKTFHKHRRAKCDYDEHQLVYLQKFNDRRRYLFHR
jgi:hypothetical protein